MSNPTDHDLLITLDIKVSQLMELNAKVDSLMELRGKFDSILARLNGHVPTKCILHDEKIEKIEKQLETNEQASRWGVGTAIAVASLLVAAGSFILSITLR